MFVKKSLFLPSSTEFKPPILLNGLRVSTPVIILGNPGNTSQKFNL